MASRADRIGRNFFLLSAGRFLTALLAIAITFYLTRALGAERYGIIALATGLATWAGVAVDAGLGLLGARAIARSGGTPPGLVGRMVRLRLALLPAAMALTVAVAWFLPLPAPGRLVIALYALALSAAAIDLKWVFIGLERLKPVALNELASQAIMLPAVAALVRSPEDLLLMPWIFLAARLAPALGLAVHFRAIRKDVASGVEQGAPPLRLREALPLGGTTTLIMTIQHFPLLALGWMSGAQAAGWFGAAQRVVWGPMLLAQAYYASLMSSVNRGGVEGAASVEKLLSRSLRLAGGMAVGLAVGGIMVADPLVRLFFGSEFAPASAALGPLLIAVGFMLMHRHFGLLLVAFDAQAKVFRIYGLATALAVGLTPPLVVGWGVAGAAVALALAQALILLLETRTARRQIAEVAVVRHLLRPMPAAAVMAAFLWASAPWPVLLRILAGGAIYLIGLGLMGVVRPEEWRVMLRSLGPRRQAEKRRRGRRPSP